MAKSLKERLQEYLLDLKAHADRLKKGEIRFAAFLRAVAQETRKVVYRVSKGETTHERKYAIDLVKRGMLDYNAKRYKDAEDLFRRAVGKDANYGRAHAYLGNALYKQKRITDAITAWNKAIEVEPNSDAADLAKEKIYKVTNGRDGLFDMVDDMMVHPRA